MAESEIQILIRAVDEVSATVKNIEGNMGKMSGEVSKQTEKTTAAFQQSTTTLLALGNAAGTVDRIFSSYQNLQIRLENAQERVTGALDRQANALYNLNKVTSDSEATTEDIAEAQRQYESTTRSVTIAQNNLERAHNQVIGTYINMGVQTLTLIASLPTLIASISSMTASLFGMTAAEYASAGGFMAITVAGAPLWAIILAIIAVVAGVILLWKHWDDMSTKLKITLALLAAPLVAIFLAIKLIVAIVELAINAFKKLFGIAGKKSGLTMVNEEAPGTINLSKQQGDFVSRPGQSPISFSPSDTIVGVKDIDSLRGGGGISITITGNIYGTDPDEIAVALANKIKKSIRL